MGYLKTSNSTSGSGGILTEHAFPMQISTRPSPLRSSHIETLTHNGEGFRPLTAQPQWISSASSQLMRPTATNTPEHAPHTLTPHPTSVFTHTPELCHAPSRCGILTPFPMHWHPLCVLIRGHAPRPAFSAHSSAPAQPSAYASTAALIRGHHSAAGPLMLPQDQALPLGWQGTGHTTGAHTSVSGLNSKGGRV